MKWISGNNLFFVHVPKCAGMSVRAALTRVGGEDWSPVASDLGLDADEAARITERGRGFDHPVLGLCHPAHLPLALLRDHMPRTWQCLTGAQSFALIRAPRPRFLSALTQRMKEFQDVGAIRIDDPRVADEAIRVCEWLDGRGPYAEISHIHFARQTNYVQLDGQRVVANIFPVERTDALACWLQDKLGVPVEISHDHIRRQPLPWARSVQPLARFIGRRLMPATLRQALHPLYTKSRLFDAAAKSYGTVHLGDDVEAFINRYYAADAALHRSALADAGRIAPQKDAS